MAEKRLFSTLTILTLIFSAATWAKPGPNSNRKPAHSEITEGYSEASGENKGWQNYICRCEETCTRDSLNKKRSLGRARLKLYNNVPSSEEGARACTKQHGAPYKNSFGGCGWSDTGCDVDQPGNDEGGGL